MSFRFFCFIPLCLILCGCSSSYCDELSLEEVKASADVTDESTSESTASEDALNGQDIEADEVKGNPEEIYVYACGKVGSPGVYKVPEGSRVFEVLSLAGGPLEEADISAINQAETCYDGEMIYVPAVGESIDPAGEMPGIAPSSDGRIDINTADSEKLQQLKGIGASRAEDIISYREKNGKFTDIESIMNVPGIKQGTFDKIKDDIKV